MSRVTSKLQVTIPKRIAEEHGIRPGDDIAFESTGEAIRIRTEATAGGTGEGRMDVATRLALFKEATRRQARRNATWRRRRDAGKGTRGGRGWKREDLYERGIPC